ncbi:type IV toxin-antitoxin system AbiEi family antitoxin domain-containing protein [Cellulomonas alba]|uniref:Transcriptional regulator, AbiEi antitoxin, Type IV TA system n=1 Tax=Cellulomonas alba TaxID=3053467 RepID=A0ABT7SKG4_9CELL|nr:type IV toxin-antitoxin system AbiEi family antitoxin domain-containing protein [Cellulomonas alba]MDM7856022.1 hypothetical protein [Cellulomonas alba]
MDDETLLASLPDGVVVLDDARRIGLDPRRLYLAERRGRLVRVRPGAFVRTREWEGLAPGEQHVLVVRAAASVMRHVVFSHDSAAALWGMPLVAPPAAIHVSRARSGGSSWTGVVRHRGAGDLAVHERDGVRVTSAVDTVLDLAASLPFACAVPAADHALRAGLVTADALAAGVAERAGRRGVARSAAVARFADARSESPGESLSRARMHELGLPAPRLQTEFAERGEVVARVDFWWPEARLVGEFDGRLKYRVDGIADRRSLEERLWQEKVREDRLRRAGLRVARWTWSDAMSPSRLATILSRAGLRRALGGGSAGEIAQKRRAIARPG